MTARLRIARPILLALGAATLYAAPLLAQESSLASAAPLSTASASQPAPASVGPTVDAASVAVRNVAAENRAAPQRAGKNLDQGTKLMIIGGAAILTGIVIGGDAGHAISIAGAVLGLYGLYKYLE